jgi:hypothetical protein
MAAGGYRGFVDFWVRYYWCRYITFSSTKSF